MGVSNVLYPFGFQYQDPKKPYAMDGFVNGPDAIARRWSSTSRCTSAARRRG